MSNVQHDCINLEYPSFFCCLYVTAWGFSPFLVNLFSNARVSEGFYLQITCLKWHFDCSNQCIQFEKPGTVAKTSYHF